MKDIQAKTHVVGPLAVAGRLGLEEVAAPRPPGRAPVEAGPGPAPDGEELTVRLEGLVRLIEAPALPALVRAALVHAEMVAVRPFTAGNAAVGRLLVRHLIARDGLEPTGVAVVDAYAFQAPVIKVIEIPIVSWPHHPIEDSGCT